MMEGVEEILRGARAAGAAEAEVYAKTSRGRRLILEPGLLGGRPRITVSTFFEEGVAVRVLDRRGHSGFAWGSPAGVRRAVDLAEMALESAGAAAPEPLAIPFAPPAPAALVDPVIGDPEIAVVANDRLIDLLEQAAGAAAEAAGAAAEVDRAALSTAAMSISLANSFGFSGEYDRSPAHLSVSMAPAAPGARAALEERAACRLRDLEPRACGLEAARRSLPPRPVVPPPAGDLPLILAPRAAASLLWALLPWLLHGGGTDLFPGGGRGRAWIGGKEEPRGGLRVIDDASLPDRPGSAPFDGAGRPTGRTLLLAGGRVAGRLSAGGGNTVRASFRDPPLVGPSNLYIAPGGAFDPGIPPDGARAGEPPGSDPAEPCLRVAAARFVAGPGLGIHVLRGDWHTAGGPAGPADGLFWAGPLQAVLEGVVAAGTDLGFFHPGTPIGAPTLRLEGIGPWVVQGIAARPAAGPPLHPDGRPGRPPDQAASR